MAQSTITSALHATGSGSSGGGGRYQANLALAVLSSHNGSRWVWLIVLGCVVLVDDNDTQNAAIPSGCSKNNALGHRRVVLESYKCDYSGIHGLAQNRKNQARVHRQAFWRFVEFLKQMGGAKRLRCCWREILNVIWPKEENCSSKAVSATYLL